jgi:hypothetical protein
LPTLIDVMVQHRQCFTSRSLLFISVLKIQASGFELSLGMHYRHNHYHSTHIPFCMVWFDFL